MKRADFKRKSSVIYIGKGIIVLTLVVTTSIGFIFGFFVGKYFRPPLESHATGNGISLETSLSQTYSPASKTNTLTDKTGLGSQILPSTQETTETKVNNSDIQIQQVPSTEHLPVHSTDSSTIKNLVETENAKLSDFDQKKNTVPVPKKKIYAVQVGAFTNPDDAHSLKSKFDKKGYSSDLVITNSTHKKVYKVLIGKFTSKNAAETFSQKIKQTETIQAFVVLK